MSDNGRGAHHPKGEMSPEEIAEFKRRADQLGQKIGGTKSEKQAEIEAQEDRARHNRGMAMGLRMSTELVAAILVGGVIGWGIDQGLGSTPWFFLIFFILGFAAGILNVTRGFQRMQAEIEQEKRSLADKPVPADQDEDDA
ncbi:MAG: AtpZ/AtpI family protein [Hyphomicrobium sp.]|nr:AtpZ/AtpI family protein [Hyphomicrobium sp.]